MAEKVRTDDDTWNPITGVGTTATFGAVARAVATSKGLINDPFAELLVRAAGVEYFIRIVDDARYAADDRDKNLMNGLIDVLATHTRFLDVFLADACRAGIRQVVILASGMDTRPYRLWWPAGTTVYEIDQPEVVDFKSQVLRGVGAKLSANRRAVGIDLRQDWLAALRRVGFDASQRTVWIVENLLVGYLTPDEQNRLLQDVTAVSVVGSRFAADHMSTWTPMQLQAGHAFVGLWQQFGLDVDLSALTYPGEYRDVPDYLSARGWQTVDRNLVELCATMGMSRRVQPRDVEITLSYVTATRV